MGQPAPWHPACFDLPPEDLWKVGRDCLRRPHEDCTVLPVAEAELGQHPGLDCFGEYYVDCGCLDSSQSIGGFENVHLDLVQVEVRFDK